jgi:hypothetical protein
VGFIHNAYELQIFKQSIFISAYRQCRNTDYAGVIDPETRSEKYSNKVG